MISESPSIACSTSDEPSTAIDENSLDEIDEEFVFQWCKEILEAADSKGFSSLIEVLGKESFQKVVMFRDSHGKSLADYVKESVLEAEKNHKKCIAALQRDNVKNSPPDVLQYTNHYSNILCIGNKIDSFQAPAAVQTQAA